MNVTRDDVVAYTRGDVLDPLRCHEIEQAIRQRDEAAEWYEEGQDELEGEPAAVETTQARVKQFLETLWTAIAWLRKEPGSNPLPQSGNVDGTEIEVLQSDDSLVVDFGSTTADVQPDFLMALVPDVDVRRLTLGKPRVTEVRTAAVMIDQTDEASPSVASVQAAIPASQPRRETRQFETSDGRGFSAWIARSDFHGTHVGCELLSGPGLLAVGRYRFWSRGAKSPAVEGRFSLDEAPLDEVVSRLRAGATIADLPPTGRSERPWDDRSRSDLLSRLQDPNESDWVRADAARVVGYFGDDAVRRALIKVLGKPEIDHTVRAAAAEALGRSRDDQARRAIIEVSEQAETPQVIRKACREALVQGLRLLTGTVELKGVHVDASSPPDWTLEIAIGDPRDVKRFTTSELRELPTRALEIIPLVRATDGRRFTATLRESQRQAWNDPDALHLVRLMTTN